MVYAGLDWIVPIIFIIVAVVQVLAKGKRIASGKEPLPEKVGDEWKDLLEALGQKTKTEEGKPIEPPPILIQKEPHMRMKPPVKPLPKKAKAVVVEAKEDEFVGRHIVEMPSETADAEKKKEPQKKSPVTPVHDVATSKESNIFAILRKRETVRDAILINEILAPPVSLRA